MGKMKFDRQLSGSMKPKVNVLSSLSTEKQVIIKEKIVEIPVEKIVTVEKIIEVPVEKVVENTKIIDYTKEIKELQDKFGRMSSTINLKNQYVDAKVEEVNDRMQHVDQEIHNLSSDIKVLRAGILFIQKQNEHILKEQVKSAKIHIALGIGILISLILHIL